MADRPHPLIRSWPWLVLVLMTMPAIWHVVDFPDDIDGEYPRVERPTFNARPPSAYRLAEPGDTIDRIALYASSAIVAVSISAWAVSRKARLWPVAIVLGLACGWFAVTPGPCYDGWHGLGWRAIGNADSPILLRIGLGLVAILFVGIAVISAAYAGGWASRPSIPIVSDRAMPSGGTPDPRASAMPSGGTPDPRASDLARYRGVRALFLVSAILIAARSVEIPGVEPLGYWPRWAFSLGLISLGMAIIRLYPKTSVRGRIMGGLGTVAMTSLLIFAGLKVTWLHRPLERLHAVVPGRIYISAMPTYRGLEVEQSRLHFKTIINLFPEESLKDKLSKRLPDELRFAREHGIRYVESPGTAVESDTFLDETLAIAQDPNSWPILVHCHGCMDRSPAWMGIYRFVIQDRPLIEIMKEIEAHRGVRPKASVTLLYNRVLPPRAPQHYRTDPTASILKDAARRTSLSDKAVEDRMADAKPKDSPRR